jgi:FHS family Na+ dependent glucose MFS transporter 1
LKNRISEFFKNAAVFRTVHYYFLFIYLGLSVGISGPTLPALAGQVGISLGQMGSIFLLSAFGYTLGTYLGGRLLDRFNGHKVLGTGQLISAVFIMLLPIIPWFWLFFVVVLLKGVSDGLLNGANTLLIWTHAEKAAPFMNAMHFFFGLGAFLSPFIVARLVSNPLGYRLAYWGVGVFAVLVGLRMFFLPGSPTQHHAHNSEDSTPVPVSYPLVIASAFFLFFYVGAEITYSGWIFTYATTLQITNAAGAAYLTSGFWLSFTIGRLISIPVSTRLHPRNIITAGLAGCLIILILLILMPSSTIFLWIATIILGFCMAPLWPTGYTLAGQSIKLTARLSAIILTGDSLGGMLLPWFVGLAIDFAGAKSMVPFVFASMVFNLITFFIVLHLAGKSNTAHLAS